MVGKETPQTRGVYKCWSETPSDFSGKQSDRSDQNITKSDKSVGKVVGNSDHFKNFFRLYAHMGTTRMDIKNVDEEVKTAVEKLAKEKGITMGEAIKLLVEHYKRCPKWIPEKAIIATKNMAERMGAPPEYVMVAALMLGLDRERELETIVKTMLLVRDIEREKATQ
ncbi:MAG: hypothetical protein GXO39_05395 [Thermotogae bacterium]|nr:hypothetical protein [Thermotogota bacterium]